MSSNPNLSNAAEKLIPAVVEVVEVAEANAERTGSPESQRLIELQADMAETEAQMAACGEELETLRKVMSENPEGISEETRVNFEAMKSAMVNLQKDYMDTMMEIEGAEDELEESKKTATEAVTRAQPLMNAMEVVPEAPVEAAVEAATNGINAETIMTPATEVVEAKVPVPEKIEAAVEQPSAKEQLTGLLKEVLDGVKDLPKRIQNEELRERVANAIAANQKDGMNTGYMITYDMVRNPNILDYMSERGVNAQKILTQVFRAPVRTDELLGSVKRLEEQLAVAKQTRAEDKLAGRSSDLALDRRVELDDDAFIKTLEARVASEMPENVKAYNERVAQRTKQFGDVYRANRDSFDLSKNLDPDEVMTEPVRKAIIEDRKFFSKLFNGNESDKVEGYEPLESWYKRRADLRNIVAEEMVQKGIDAINTYVSEETKAKAGKDYQNDATVMSEVKERFGAKIDYIDTLRPAARLEVQEAAAKEAAVKANKKELDAIQAKRDSWYDELRSFDKALEAKLSPGEFEEFKIADNALRTGSKQLEELESKSFKLDAESRANERELNSQEALTHRSRMLDQAMIELVNEAIAAGKGELSSEDTAAIAKSMRNVYDNMKDLPIEIQRLGIDGYVASSIAKLFKNSASERQAKLELFQSRSQGFANTFDALQNERMDLMKRQSALNREIDTRRKQLDELDARLSTLSSKAGMRRPSRIVS